MKSLDRPRRGSLSKAMVQNVDPSSWPPASKARIAVWRKLRTRKGREKSGQLVVEGVRLVGEALVSGCAVEALLVADDPSGYACAKRTLALSKRWTGPVARVSPRDFSQITDTVHSAGVAAIVAWHPRRWQDRASIRTNRLLFCDSIADPGNLGTLVRAAAGLGLDAVFVSPNSVELTNPKTIRATVGANFRIPLLVGTPVAPFAMWCQERGITIFVADPGRGRSLRPERLAKRWTLVIGGETGRLNSAWSAADITRIRIPMRRGVESLNAAVAGAILMDRLCHRVGRRTEK